MTTTSQTIGSDAIDAVNTVLRGTRDGATNYRNAADDLRRRDIADTLLQFAADNDACAAELEAELRRLGHEPDAGGSVAAKARRAVQEAKTAVSGHDDSSTLSEIEGGLDQAEKYYQLALRQPVPAQTRALLERQNHTLQQHHDRVTAYLRQDPGGKAA